MPHATKPINTPTRPGRLIYPPIAAATIIYAGTLVAANASGHAVPASDAPGLRVMGCAQETVDNSEGAAAAAGVSIRPGCFRFNNSGSDAVTASETGKFCFIEDDNTVCKTGGAHRIIAGRVFEVEADGVWIELVRFPSQIPSVVLASVNGAVLAAGNEATVKAEMEKVGDDARALWVALVAAGYFGG